MASLDDLTDRINNLVNDLKSQNEEEVEYQREPHPKQWWHMGDWLTRQDELLEQILLAVRELRQPVIIERPPPAPPALPPAPPIPPIPEDLLGKMDTLISLTTNINDTVKNLPVGKRTKVLNFSYNIGVGQTVMLADNVPFNGNAVSVLIEFPSGCNSLVDVNIRAGSRGIVPQVGYVSLNDVTPIFTVREPVVIGEEIIVEIRNRDTLNAHSIEVNVIIMEE